MSERGHFRRPPTWQSGIGDIFEGPIVGKLVGVFAQLGEPTCVEAVRRAEAAKQAVDRAVEEARDGDR